MDFSNMFAGLQTNAANAFQDRNFLNLLAGVGTGLDPEGVGGAIGQPTQQMIKNVAMQDAAKELGTQRTDQMQQLIAALGGFTPKGQAGVTGMKTGKDGNVMLEIDPIKVEGNDQTSAAPAPAPAPTAPAVKPTTGGIDASPFWRALQA